MDIPRWRNVVGGDACDDGGVVLTMSTVPDSPALTMGSGRALSSVKRKDPCLAKDPAGGLGPVAVETMKGRNLAPLQRGSVASICALSSSPSRGCTDLGDHWGAVMGEGQTTLLVRGFAWGHDNMKH